MKQTAKQPYLQIGGVKLPHPFLLAPMAGMTDSAFRLLAGEQGAALAYTEMVSAKGMTYGDRGSNELLQVVDAEEAGRLAKALPAGAPKVPAEPPCAVQLFGSEEYVLRRAVQLLPGRKAAGSKQAGAGTDAVGAPAGAPMHCMIDINMGCPVPKVVKNGEGSALMNDRFTAAALVRAAVAAESEEAARAGREPRPVTVKCRLGWDEKSRRTILDFAPQMQEAGAAAICIHGRTREQFYSGTADWNAIFEAKQRVTVPVIGSGDLFTAEAAVTHIKSGACDAVLFARGALGNPWIFREALALWEAAETGSVSEAPLQAPTFAEKQALMLRHLDLSCALKGEKRAVPSMRQFWGFYLKGIPGAAGLRRRINELTSADELRALLASLQEPGISDPYIPANS